MPNFPSTFVIHAVGRSDLGLPPGSQYCDQEKECLAAINANPEDAGSTLLWNTEDGKIGKEAPLTSALTVISEENLQLLLLATGFVLPIAEVLQSALKAQPCLYGREVRSVRIIKCLNLKEQEVAVKVRDSLEELNATKDNRFVVTWGSGSTQLTLGALDSLLDQGLPWSISLISESGPGVSRRYDPTDGLSIHPVIPLLRRWRYHELIMNLIDDGSLGEEWKVSEDQRRLLAGEAERWGYGFTTPTADNLRAMMAAGLMRGDGTSGFAVRQYIHHRYQELRKSESPMPTDLLKWAEDKCGSKAMLGTLRGKIKKSKKDEAESTASGRWIIEGCDFLNEIGKLSEHELKLSGHEEIKILRDHLATCENTPSTEVKGLSSLSLAPSQTIWYVAIAGIARKESEKRPFILTSIADAIHSGADSVDPEVRKYLGISDGGKTPVAFLALGTSDSYDNASQAIKEIRREYNGECYAVAHKVEYGNGESLTAEKAIEILRRHLDHTGPTFAPGAIVLVPAGPKTLVMLLLEASQKLAAEYGIPLYLRQLVDKNQSVDNPGLHRLPLRFGTDFGVIKAANYALDTVELDTAARLLSVTSGGSGYAYRAQALANALRCDLGERPEEYRDWSEDDYRRRLIADRIEVWARAAKRHSSDVSMLIRAILGARASCEASLPQKERGELNNDAKLKLLNCVRNKLPITHGDPLDSPQGLNAMIEKVSKKANTVELLDDMVSAAREKFQSHPGPYLADLVDELREEIKRLCDKEQQRLMSMGSYGHASP